MTVAYLQANLQLSLDCRLFSWGLKWLGWETGQSSTSSVTVKNDGTLPPLPQVPSWHAQGQLLVLPVMSAAHFAVTCTLSSAAQHTPAGCYIHCTVNWWSYCGWEDDFKAVCKCVACSYVAHSGNWWQLFGTWSLFNIGVMFFGNLNMGWDNI